MSSVVVKWLDEQHVRQCMDRYAERLLQNPLVEEVVVFGSFQHGDWVPGSDIDVFLILSSSDKSVRDRVPDFLPGAFPVGVDLFPYTRSEVAALAPSALLEDVRRSTWRYRRKAPNAPLDS